MIKKDNPKKRKTENKKFVGKVKDTANKRNDSQKLADYLEIAILNHKGKNQGEIAEILSNKRSYTLSQQQISYDMKALKELWKRETVFDVDTEKGRLKSHIELLIKEAHIAWARSREDVVTVSEGFNGQGAFKSTTRKGQAGDPRFIAEIRALLKEYRDLFGIDPPKKIEGTGVGIFVLPVGVDVDKI